jgi:hypothetical protein
MRDFYISALLRYAYHLPHVIILGKKECGLGRQQVFENMVGSVKTRRDYAEGLSATFNIEIQSQHFGNGRSLSIEGSTVETHEKIVGDNANKMRLQFHSRQDATTTTAHMTVLINSLLLSQNSIDKQSTMWDDTDGCAVNIGVQKHIGYCCTLPQSMT